MSGMSVEDAARQSGYSEGHIRRLIRNGKLEAERVGRRSYLVDEASLETYCATIRDLGEQKHAPHGV